MAELIAEADLAATTKSEFLDIKPVPCKVLGEFTGPKDSPLPPLLKERMKTTASNVLRDAQKQFADYVGRLDKEIAATIKKFEDEAERVKNDDKMEPGKKKAWAKKQEKAVMETVNKFMKGYEAQCKKAVELEGANASKFARAEVEYMAQTDEAVKKWKIKTGFKIAWAVFKLLAKIAVAVAATAASIALAVVTAGGAVPVTIAVVTASLGLVASAGKDIYTTASTVAKDWTDLDTRQMQIKALALEIQKEQDLAEKKNKGMLEKLKNAKNKLSNLVSSKVESMEEQLNGYEMALKRAETGIMKMSVKVEGPIDATLKTKQELKAMPEQLKAANELGDKLAELKVQIEMMHAEVEIGRRWVLKQSAALRTFKSKAGKLEVYTNKAVKGGKVLKGIGMFCKQCVGVAQTISKAVAAG